MDLETLREEIRKKDEEIIRLIGERTALAKEVGIYKKENELPVRNPEVEKKVIDRYLEIGRRYGIDDTTMASVARMLIEEAVAAEERILDE